MTVGDSSIEKVTRQGKSLRERFMDKVSPEPNSGCWLWMGVVQAEGYGGIWDGERMQQAHRVAYELFCGPIPKDRELDHLCRMRCCVNPKHLEPVTRKENCRRSPLIRQNGAEHREKTHCLRGHPYDEENTLFRKSRNGRLCRECKRLRAAASRRRLKAIALG